jgi:hypothetical protein
MRVRQRKTSYRRGTPDFKYILTVLKEVILVTSCMLVNKELWFEFWWVKTFLSLLHSIQMSSVAS